MKKSLIALAMAGLFASAAQAADNYSIYGRLDLSVIKANTKGEDNIRLENGTQSRLGFKGTEELGNSGLKGNFKIEHRFDADTGNTREGNNLGGKGDRFWRAQSWVGLSGAFGEVRLGRQYDALANTSDQIDPFGGDFVLTKSFVRVDNAGNLVKVAEGIAGIEGLGFGAPASRRDNTISYFTPDMKNGFSAEGYLTFGEGNYSKTGEKYAASKDRNLFGFRLAYDMSDMGTPFAVSFAYQQTGDSDKAKAALAGLNAANVAAAGIGDNTNLTTANIELLGDVAAANQAVKAAKADGSQMALYAGYTLNKETTFGFGYFAETVKNSDLTSLTGVKGDAKTMLYTLSVSHNVSKNSKVIAGYQFGKTKDTDTTDNTNYADQKYSRLALGYHHGLSDRTTLYVNLATEKLKNADWKSGVDADTNTVYQFGVKHNF